MLNIVNSVLNSVLNVKAFSGCFQPGEGPSRGLLHDCETSNFAKVRLQLYWVGLAGHQLSIGYHLALLPAVT